MSNMLESLVSPFAGLVGRVGIERCMLGDARVWLAYAHLGDVDRVLPRLPTNWRPAWTDDGLTGLGVGMDEGSARVRALAEAVERHAACTFSEAQFVLSTACELDGEVLDLTQIPRCSRSELDHPACPLREPDPGCAIRWVRGLSLTTGRLMWIPAVMAFIRFPLTDDERFYLPMSTGCAAHSSLEQALINALCEVIERDAAALVWLLRLPIAEIDLTVARKRGPLMSLLRSVPHLRCCNATTDVGIPVVYGVESDRSDREFATLVTCSCEPEPWRAIAKIACEVIAYRPILRVPREIPNDPDCFSQGIHGAKYMGAPARQDAFEFLFQGTPHIEPEELPRLNTASAPILLAQLLTQLESQNKEVFAVELTTTEALRARLRVVRVIIPAMLPLTFRLRARYLAHPRLDQAARAMGYAPRTEKDLSPWPQPIA